MAQDNGETGKKCQWILVSKGGGRGPPRGNRIKANRYRAGRHGKPRKSCRQKRVAGFVAYLFDGQRHTDAVLFDEDHVPAGFWRLCVAVNGDDGWTGVVGDGDGYGTSGDDRENSGGSPLNSTNHEQIQKKINQTK